MRRYDWETYVSATDLPPGVSHLTEVGVGRKRSKHQAGGPIIGVGVVGGCEHLCILWKMSPGGAAAIDRFVAER